jgi:hypothetical protein
MGMYPQSWKESSQDGWWRKNATLNCILALLVHCNLSVHWNILVVCNLHPAAYILYKRESLSD